MDEKENKKASLKRKHPELNNKDLQALAIKEISEANP